MAQETKAPTVQENQSNEILKDTKDILEYQDKKVVIKKLPQDGEEVAVFARPGDEIEIKGVDLGSLEYRFVGGDIVVTMPNGGVLTFVSMALMSYSENPPSFTSGNQRFSLSDVLSQVDEINDLPLESIPAELDIQKVDKVKKAVSDEDETDEKAFKSTVQQQELEDQISELTDQLEEQKDKVDSLEFEANNQPSIEGIIDEENNYTGYYYTAPRYNGSGTGYGTGYGTGTTDGPEDAAKPEFYFKATAHQVKQVDYTSDEGVRTLAGGGGSIDGYKYDSITNQYEDETIDMSASTEDMVIRSENTTYFSNDTSSVYLSRVLRFEPQMPEGFYVKSFTFSSLPSGVTLLDKNGNEISGKTITIDDFFVKDAQGNILNTDASGFAEYVKSAEFTIKYTDPDSLPSSFNLNITANYDLDSAYEETTDLDPNQTFTNSYTFVVKDIEKAEDFTYNTKKYPNGHEEGFVLAKDINDNIIIDGSGNSTIYGGIAKDVVYDGAGDDTINLSAGSDIVYGGAGNNIIDGDAYTSEDGVDASYNDGRDKVSYAKVNSFSLAEVEYLKANNIISTEDAKRLTGSYEELDVDGNVVANPIDVEMLKYTKGVYVDLNGFTDENTLWVDSDGDGFVDDDEKINALSKYFSKVAFSDDFKFIYNVDGDVTGHTGTITTSNQDNALKEMQLIGQDKFKNIEDVDGSAYNDTIYGNDSKNIINGLAGSDILDGRGGGNELDGGAGYDTIYSGTGNDTIDGGDDTDNVNYQNSVNGVIVRLDKPNGDDKDDYAESYDGATIVYDTEGKVSGYTQSGLLYKDTLVSIEDVVGSTHDDIIFGSGSTNYIEGMEGDDKIIGGGGYDFIDGGADNDWISYYKADYTRMNSIIPGGVASTDYMETIDGITVTMGTDFVMLKETDTGRLIDLIKDIEQVGGTKGRDYIWGDGSDETFWGYEGDDNLRGWNGADNLYGGDGDDYLLPGRGVDYTDGGEGIDFLHLYYDALKNKTQQWLQLDASGTVQYSTDSGINWIDGYNTSDGVNYAINIEGLHGSSGADHFIGNDEENKFTGHNGEDELYGMGGNDTIDGGNDDDIIYGGDGDDILSGGNHDDYLDGGEGDDTFYGSIRYSNTVRDSDEYHGGNGEDTLDYGKYNHNYSMNVTIDATQNGTITFGGSASNNTLYTDSFTSIERFIASRGADTIDASSTTQGMFISGMYGNDAITGGSGDDTLYGGAHTDTITGGNGNDYINLDQYSDIDLRVHGVTDTAYGGDGNDTIVSQGGSDYLYGNDGDDTFIVNYRPKELHGGNGDDTLTLGDTYLYLRNTDMQGMEKLNIGSGRTYLNHSQLFTDNDFDTITGDENSQLFIYGTNSAETFDFSGIDLSGFSGTMYLYGYNGNDTFDFSGATLSGSSNFLLDAGGNTDTLILGAGQSIHMTENYYNTFENFDIAAGATLEVTAYNNNSDTFNAHNKDFDDVSGEINFIGSDSNDTFYVDYEALSLGKITIDGQGGSDMVDVRTSINSGTLNFDEASMFANIERLELDQYPTRTNTINIDATVVDDWLSAGNSNLTLDIYNEAQGDLVHVNNTDSGVTTGYDRGSDYNISPANSDPDFTMSVV